MVPVGYKPHGAARNDPETPMTDPRIGITEWLHTRRVLIFS